MSIDHLPRPQSIPYPPSLPNSRSHSPSRSSFTGDYHHHHRQQVSAPPDEDALSRHATTPNIDDAASNIQKQQQQQHQQASFPSSAPYPPTSLNAAAPQHPHSHPPTSRSPSENTHHPNNHARRVCATCNDDAPSGWRRSIERPGLTVCNKCGLAERARAKRHRENQTTNRLPSSTSLNGHDESQENNNPWGTRRPPNRDNGRECFTCHAVSSAAWRTSLQHPGQTVCNKCGLRERKGRERRAQPTTTILVPPVPPITAPGGSNRSQQSTEVISAYGHGHAPAGYHPMEVDRTSDVPPAPNHQNLGQRMCTSCGVVSSASWRRSLRNPSQMLCNKCGLRERKYAKNSQQQAVKEMKAKSEGMISVSGSCGPPIPTSAVRDMDPPLPMKEERGEERKREDEEEERKREESGGEAKFLNRHPPSSVAVVATPDAPTTTAGPNASNASNTPAHAQGSTTPAAATSENPDHPPEHTPMDTVVSEVEYPHPHQHSHPHLPSIPSYNPRQTALNHSHIRTPNLSTISPHHSHHPLPSHSQSYSHTPVLHHSHPNSVPISPVDHYPSPQNLPNLPLPQVHTSNHGTGQTQATTSQNQSQSQSQILSGPLGGGGGGGGGYSTGAYHLPRIQTPSSLNPITDSHATHSHYHSGLPSDHYPAHVHHGQSVGHGHGHGHGNGHGHASRSLHHTASSLPPHPSHSTPQQQTHQLPHVHPPHAAVHHHHHFGHASGSVFPPHSPSGLPYTGITITPTARTLPPIETYERRKGDEAVDHGAGHLHHPYSQGHGHGHSLHGNPPSMLPQSIASPVERFQQQQQQQHPPQHKRGENNTKVYEWIAKVQRSKDREGGDREREVDRGDRDGARDKGRRQHENEETRLRGSTPPRKCFVCSSDSPSWRSSVMYPGQLVCSRCGQAERQASLSGDQARSRGIEVLHHPQELSESQRARGPTYGPAGVGPTPTHTGFGIPDIDTPPSHSHFIGPGHESGASGNGGNGAHSGNGVVAGVGGGGNGIASFRTRVHGLAQEPTQSGRSPMSLPPVIDPNESSHPLPNHYRLYDQAQQQPHHHTQHHLQNQQQQQQTYQAQYHHHRQGQVQSQERIPFISSVRPIQGTPTVPSASVRHPHSRGGDTHSPGISES